jgi:DNA-binding MarR family transcriptional regulator
VTISTKELTGSLDEEFRLEEFLPHRLSVASDFVSRVMGRQYLDQIGVSLAEWRLLAAVGRYGVLSPTAAGVLTEMDKVKVSRAAVSLAQRGYLKQGQDPNDGRGRLLRLSRKGTTLYRSIPPMSQHIASTLSRGLSASEWSAMHRSLIKLIEHTKDLLNGHPLEND